MCLKLHNLDPLNDMLTQEKIINFVRHERKTFKDLPDPCTVIGSAGLLLCGLLIPYVSDIDILTSKRNYEILKKTGKNISIRKTIRNTEKNSIHISSA